MINKRIKMTVKMPITNRAYKSNKYHIEQMDKAFDIKRMMRLAKKEQFIKRFVNKETEA